MTDSGIVLTDEFTHALALLRDGHNLFLTGRAGTGKSTLIRHFREETERATLVAAPTGIAALNVGGYTIHRLFSFHPSHTVEHVRSAAYRPGRYGEALAGVRTLILDEASMIRADTFDMIVTALQRFGPDPSAPFGGVQIVLVGDLFQLPPVVTEHEQSYFEDHYPTPYFFSARDYRHDEFPTVDLTHVFRQSGDPRLTTILNTIREGTLVGRSRDVLNSRTDAEFEPPDDEFWLTLTTTNRLAASRNRRRLERLEGEEIESRAGIDGDVDSFEPPTEEVLRFKVGAQIMLLTNDPADRWVNGSIGRVIDVTTTGREREPLVIVRFTGGDVAEVSPVTWEVTRPVADGGSIRHEVVGTFRQLPFKLAWAITIHKSQGQTLDRVIVDLTGGTFATGQLYVALSRCTSLDGLVLTRPVFAKDLKTDRRIVRFLSAPDTDDRDRRYCAVAPLTVGDSGSRSRPRPVELAVAFDDGTAVSTLINPQRDLAEARTDFGITVSDVLIAPTLLEAWSMLAPLLDGHTPVGVDVDRMLGYVDFELKRLGSASPVPLGVELPAQSLTVDERERLRSGSAVDRAITALAARHRLDVDDPSAGSFDLLDASDDDASDDDAPDAPDAASDNPAAEPAVSYLLSRDPDTHPPASELRPQLTAMLEVSRELGPLLLGTPPSATPRDPGADEPTTRGDAELLDSARTLVAEQIRRAAERVTLTSELLDRLREAGTRLLGTDLAAGLEAAGSSSPQEIFSPGTRVCFTGSATRSDGSSVSREEMVELAEARGLTAVGNVTKTRCDALVTAEVGSQSKKARDAAAWGKPVVSAADFLVWASR